MALRHATWPAIVGIAALLLAAGDAQAQYYPKPYFSPKGGGAAATAKAIDGATSTIDVAMYSISTSGPIWDALKRAVNRGIRVRIILNKANTARMKKKATALENIGVHVFRVSKTLHQKFAIIDAGEKYYKRKLLNGSANWSSGAEHKYSENTVLFGRHNHLVYAFQMEFNHLLSIAKPVSDGAEDEQEAVSMRIPSTRYTRYERAIFSSANHDRNHTINKGESLTKLATFYRVSVEDLREANDMAPNASKIYAGDTLVIPAAEEVIASEIIELMWKAEESIIIDVAHFNKADIAEALIEIHEEYPDIEIEVLVDQGEIGAWSISQVSKLEKAGIEVRYKTYSLAFLHPESQLMHHKTLIVDGDSMITGSYNWSNTAENKNYENVIVIDQHRRNRTLLKKFRAEHDKLWGMGRDDYPALLEAMEAQPGDDAYERYIPIHFNTSYYRNVLTLTRKEIDPLYKTGKKFGLTKRQPNGKKNVEFKYLDRETKTAVLDNDDVSGKFVSGDSDGVIGGIPQ